MATDRLACCGTLPPRTGVTHECAMPRAPKGYVACRVHDGTQDLWAAGAARQITHLVALDERGSNGGRPTVCGLTRFDERGTDYVVTRPADLPGWSMGDGGVRGPLVEQVRCPECFAPTGEERDR